MAQGIDIDGFLRKLAAGHFSEAKRILNLPYQQSVRFASKPLSRRKEPCLAYKFWEVSQSRTAFVVKFSKPLSDDPWYNEDSGNDASHHISLRTRIVMNTSVTFGVNWWKTDGGVHVQPSYDLYPIYLLDITVTVEDARSQVDKEYHTLSELSKNGIVPVPRPLYCSTAADRRTVGAGFIILSFVEGINYPCASKVPVQYRSEAFSSVMNTVARLHDYFWIDPVNDRKTEYLESAQFFKQQAETWTTNYTAVAGRHGQTYQLFSKIQREEKPSGKNTQIIHGDFDVSNIIFDHQHKVKAIVDWKWDKNGDPLSDVANFTLMFLQPEAVGYRFRHLAGHELLLGDQRWSSEEEILAVYKEATKHVFREDAYNYAKALCCLRWITVVKAAWNDNFRGHECGEYKDVTGNPQLIIDCLTEAGEQYYSKWLSSRTWWTPL